MRLGRKSKWVLAILSGLVALIALLHTGAAKELARRGIESVAGSLLDGRATLEALDYRLWSGEVELSGIALEPDISVLPFLGVTLILTPIIANCIGSLSY